MCGKNQTRLLDGKMLAIFLVKSHDTFIFSLNKKSVRVYGTLKSLKYKASSIPSGGLEVPLSLNYDCQEKWVADVMQEFVDSFYSHNLQNI